MSMESQSERGATDVDARARLEQKILTRKNFDEMWGKRNFMLAQSFIWLAIIASFASAVLVASDTPKFITALFAALPGTVIVIEKSFSFAKRTRWSWQSAAGLDELHTRLVIKMEPVATIANAFSRFRNAMEAKYPDISLEGLGEMPDAATEPAHGTVPAAGPARP